MTLTEAILSGVAFTKVTNPGRVLPHLALTYSWTSTQLFRDDYKLLEEPLNKPAYKELWAYKIEKDRFKITADKAKAGPDPVPLTGKGNQDD